MRWRAEKEDVLGWTLLFIGCLGTYLLDFLQFMTRTVALGHDKENFVLLLEVFQLRLTLLLKLPVLLESSFLLLSLPPRISLLDSWSEVCPKQFY